MAEKRVFKETFTSPKRPSVQCLTDTVCMFNACTVSCYHKEHSLLMATMTCTSSVLFPGISKTTSAGILTWYPAENSLELITDLTRDLAFICHFHLHCSDQNMFFFNFLFFSFFLNKRKGKKQGLVLFFSCCLTHVSLHLKLSLICSLKKCLFLQIPERIT